MVANAQQEEDKKDEDKVTRHLRGPACIQFCALKLNGLPSNHQLLRGLN